MHDRNTSFCQIPIGLMTSSPKLFCWIPVSGPHPGLGWTLSEGKLLFGKTPKSNRDWGQLVFGKTAYSHLASLLEEHITATRIESLILWQQSLESIINAYYFIMIFRSDTNLFFRWMPFLVCPQKVLFLSKTIYTETFYFWLPPSLWLDGQPCKTPLGYSSTK